MGGGGAGFREPSVLRSVPRPPLLLGRVAPPPVCRWLLTRPGGTEPIGHGLNRSAIEKTAPAGLLLPGSVVFGLGLYSLRGGAVDGRAGGDGLVASSAFGGGEAPLRRDDDDAPNILAALVVVGTGTNISACTAGFSRIDAEISA